MKPLSNNESHPNTQASITTEGSIRSFSVHSFLGFMCEATNRFELSDLPQTPHSPEFLLPIRCWRRARCSRLMVPVFGLSVPLEKSPRSSLTCLSRDLSSSESTRFSLVRSPNFYSAVPNSLGLCVIFYARILLCQLSGSNSNRI